MDSLQWLLTPCTPELVDAGTACVEPLQLVYIAGLAVLAVLLGVAAWRSRDFSNSVLVLMAVAIPINIAIGSIVAFLRLPSISIRSGPCSSAFSRDRGPGRSTGLLANLIWSILPVPGGAGPLAAFFSPVAAVIGLMAGFWGARGVFQLRADDVRVGSFLALALGIASAAISFLLVQQFVGLPDLSLDTTANPELEGQLLAEPDAVCYVRRRFSRDWRARCLVVRPDDLPIPSPGDAPKIRSYLAAASGLTAVVLVGFIVRLLFGPAGYFSTFATDPNVSWLASLAVADPVGLFLAPVVGILAGLGVWYWARRGENARLFPVWVGGHNHRHRCCCHLRADRGDLLRWSYRHRHGPAGLAVSNVGPQPVPVGVRPGADQRSPRQDHQLHDRLPDPGRSADNGADHVQPRRVDRRCLTDLTGSRRKQPRGERAAGRLLQARGVVAPRAPSAYEAARTALVHGRLVRPSTTRSAVPGGGSHSGRCLGRAPAPLMRSLRIPPCCSARSCSSTRSSIQGHSTGSSPSDP